MNFDSFYEFVKTASELEKSGTSTKHSVECKITKTVIENPNLSDLYSSIQNKI